MVSFQKEEIEIFKKNLKIYNYWSRSSQYTTWVLPINGESRNQKRIMCMWYLVPCNEGNEMCNVCALRDVKLQHVPNPGFNIQSVSYNFTFLIVEI